MKSNLLLVFAFVCFLGCKNDKNTTNSQENTIEKEVSEPTQKEVTLNIQNLDKWPDEIAGCACSFSKNKPILTTTKMSLLLVLKC